LNVELLNDLTTMNSFVSSPWLSARTTDNFIAQSNTFISYSQCPLSNFQRTKEQFVILPRTFFGNSRVSYKIHPSDFTTCSIGETLSFYHHTRFRWFFGFRWGFCNKDDNFGPILMCVDKIQK
jgi:hypothetical protein